MYIEGMGRVRSKHDTALDEQEQLEEAERARFERIKQEIADKVMVIDAEEKALTGRVEQDYENESLVPVRELFPESGKVLNIGDPWQTLDREGVTNLDYESGDEAEFVYTTEQLDTNLEWKGQQMERAGENFENVYPELVDQIAETLEQVQAIADAHDLKQYPEAAAILNDLRHNIAELRGHVCEDTFEGNTLRELWYDTVKLERSFADTHLVKTVIEPAVLKEALRDKGFGEAKQMDLIRRLITEHRFLKKYQYADLVKGAFPATPFEDNSFDRLVASWSLSTHMFPNMNETEFRVYWEEMDRLLKKDGVAYFWPIYRGREEEMVQSLKDYVKSGGEAAMIDRIEHAASVVFFNDPNFNLDYAETLILFKRHPSDAAVQRVVEAVQNRE